MTRLIALTGYAGSGKSTVAKHLVEKHGFTLVKFAGPLKQMMRCLALGDREIEGDLKEQPHPVLCGKSPRQAMQMLGTDWGREKIGAALWVNVAVDAAHRALDHGGSVVIDDCRFENEGEAIRRLGGEVVLVQRPGVGPVNGHVSEQLATPSHVFLNDGSEDELRAMATSYIISRNLT